MQAADRREDALDAYQAALKLLGNPEVYRNQWISIEEFERIVLDARNEWVSQGRFEEASVLSRSLTPLLPAIQALELSARANQQWAEYLQETYDTATYIRQVELKSELRDRWRQSGKSFDELAEVLRTSRRYPEALWTSAEHFRRGHDFSNALEQLVRFIDTKPARLLPTAITARGEVLMDLDRLPEAVEQFERVIEEFPTDAAAFEAEFLLGRCAMEMGDTKRAAGIWTGILDSSVLAPAANEWRLSLFWLGRLKYEQAEISHSQAEGILLAGGAAEAAKPQFRQAYLLWEEAARLLEEYVRRYPSTRERVEARYFLAKSLQNNAYRLQRDLEAARTDNARVELQRTARGLLADAAQEFLGLQEDLFILQERGRLDPIAQRVLQLSYFEHANVYYALGQYDKAIQEYNRALHRYPNSPQVLMAYTQMTNCYDHLSRPGDARIILEQARVVLNQMGPNSFDPQMTNLSKDEWDSWLQRARRLH